jgi:hypothetical protein
MTVLRMTAEMTTTSACQDINNLQACLIPNLHDMSTSLLKEVTSHHSRLTSLDTILAGQLTDATAPVAALRDKGVPLAPVATPPGAPAGTPTGALTSIPISAPLGAPTGAPTGTPTGATPDVPTNDVAPTGPPPETSDSTDPHYRPTHLSRKCRQHVGDMSSRHKMSLQFWPDGSVLPTQDLRCRGLLCRLQPTLIFSAKIQVRM